MANAMLLLLLVATSTISAAKHPTRLTRASAAAPSAVAVEHVTVPACPAPSPPPPPPPPPPPLLYYACTHGQCVKAAVGNTSAACHQSCAPMKYTCNTDGAHGKCIPDPGGTQDNVSFAECHQEYPCSRNPLPPPPGPPPPAPPPTPPPPQALCTPGTAYPDSAACAVSSWAEMARVVGLHSSITVSLCTRNQNTPFLMDGYDGTPIDYSGKQLIIFGGNATLDAHGRGSLFTGNGGGCSARQQHQY